MAIKKLHVIPLGNGWAVKHRKTIISIAGIKNDAINAAKMLSDFIVVHYRNGLIQKVFK